MFDTPEALRRELATSGTWHGIYTALYNSDPALAVRACHGDNTVDLCFEEHSRSNRYQTTGTIVISPADGVFTVNATGVHGARWYTALDSLGLVRAVNDTPPAEPAVHAWSWQPYERTRPGSLAGTFQHGAHITARTAVERAAGSENDYAAAALALIPATREACPAAWALGVTFLGVLVTADPAYRPTTPDGHPLSPAAHETATS
ncbi:hypothetical protein ACFW9F_03060 [Streptomyces sp. NPDC059506]|uniref:hypothetical protein n=1 Tax=Streptomyces sp. NPDC059506 TaxID=3347751 RepID=UPI0036D18B1F